MFHNNSNTTPLHIIILFKNNLFYIFSLDAFLSHCWSNKEHVTKVKEFLENRGFKCWIDDRQLHGGMELFHELAKAIRESKV